MGVIIGVQVTVKPSDGSKKHTVDISGPHLSKREHPLAALFFGGEEPEEYASINQLWQESLSPDEIQLLALNLQEEDEPVSFTDDLPSQDLLPILQKASQQIEDMATHIEDEEDKAQFLSSFNQLLSLAELEAKRESKLEIEFYPG